jgi:hypothetical protein
MLQTFAARSHHKTFGSSLHIKSQRSCKLCASRFGQSALSISRHFIMLPLWPYFSISLWSPCGAFDAEHVLDVAKDEIRSGHFSLKTSRANWHARFYSSGLSK